jgi:cytoskeleton protein RodZ
MTEIAARSDTDEAQAARLGAELRAARQRLGWELPQLATSLRIRQSYLEAIEGGRIADLPGTTYALGFVRAYATALGLPGEDVARRFRAATDGVNGQPALRFPAPVPRRGVPAGALMLLGLVILAGAYGGWYWVSEKRAARVETVPPIPDRLTPQGAPKSTPSPAVASLLPATAPPAAGAPPANMPPANTTPANTPPANKPPANKLPANTPPPTPPAASTPGAATPPRGQTASAAAAPPQAASAASAAPGTAAAGGGAPAGRIVIKTTADAWLTVKQPNGPPVLNKLLHAGDSWPVPAGARDLTLTTGNAGGTGIEVDGAPIPVSLGGSGAVRRDVPLDADLLKSGQLPPPKPRAKPKPAATNP